jgi:hypothetical protein
MNRWTQILTRFALVSMFGVYSLETHAQESQEQQGGTPPKPAARVYLSPIGGSDQENNQQENNLQPDDHPLTGLQAPSLGTQAERHSYWIPGISYSNAIQPNGFNVGGGKDWISTSYLTGNISLLEAFSHSKLGINYSGGEFFSTDSALGKGQFHQLALDQEFRWERWQLTFIDQFSYLPQTQFGFGGGTNLGIPGTGGSLSPSLPGLSNNNTANQTIFSGVGPRYTNSGAAQINYQMTPRTSITLGGVYGILRFTETGNIESDDVIGTAGYNYEISRRDTIGVLYRFTAYHYLRNPQAIQDHVANVAYGRKITGRLALQLFGGPEITEFRVPIGTRDQFIAGSGGATLLYGFERGSVSFGYSHGVTSGSGVFTGAKTDQVQAAASWKLSRVWSGNLGAGYAKNRSAALPSGVQGQSFDTVYANAGLGRPLGRNAIFSLGYSAYIQRVGLSACSGTQCNTTNDTHQIAISFSWHTRPFVLH